MGDKKHSNKINWAVCFSIASAWFGTHCGSGFATGAQGVSFWTAYGAYALFLPVISVIIMAVVAYIQWEFCRQYKTYDYRSYANKLFSPYDKVFATIYEILFIAIMVMGVSSVFAGAGQLISDLFGFPYEPSVIAVMILVILLNMFGSKLLVSACSILSVLLIAVILIICCVCIGQNNTQFVDVVSGWKTEGSLWKAIISGVLYGSFQCIILGATTNLSGEIETEKETKISAVFGFLMNGVMMVVLTCMLLCYYPDINKEQLPVLSAVSRLNMPVLEKAYSIMVFLAFMTTAITCIGAILKRIEGIGEKTITNITVRRALYSAVVILICFGIAQFGLLAIVKKGYTAVGYLGIPFVILPTLIIGTKKIRKAKENVEYESSKDISH